MIRVADYIVEKLKQNGADHVFMVTGRGILHLSDAVARRKDLQGISCLHEQGASYAAMSYARAGKRIGACLVSTGCAATNAITGALCAYQDSIPVVFVSGQHMLKETTRYTGATIRTYGSQEADIIRMVESVTKYAVMLTDSKDVVYEVEKALYISRHGRQGPVWIDVPLDVQSAVINPEEQEHFKEEEQIPAVPDKEVQLTAEEIRNAKRPVLFLGGGASNYKKEVKEFAEQIRIPVVFSCAACDIYGSGNEMSIGAVNSLGAPRAGNFAFQNADYVLVLGSKLCSQTIGNRPEYIARDAKVTVVDIDPAEHSKNGLKADRLLIGDVGLFLKRILTFPISCPDEWLKICLHWKNLFGVEHEKFINPDAETGRIDLYDFCNRLENYLQSTTTVITDAGLEELIVPTTICYRDNQKCLFPAAQGAMGYAVPAIIGAYFAGCRDIVAVIGDGSIMMNIQELQLLEYHHIKAKIFVINNGLYAVIRSRQKDLFRTRTIGNDSTDGVPSPNFRGLADAFGIAYFCVGGADELEEKLREVSCFDGSCLCEVMCKQEQRYFHTSFRKNERGKLVRPPIEDESPFLDRKLFLSEMIVEPVEI